MFNKKIKWSLCILTSFYFGAVGCSNKKDSVDLQEKTCDSSLWNYVYNPDRLKVIDSCKTVTGIVKSVRKEADGDYHIQVDIDEQYKGLLNDKNIKGQKGNLVVEVICAFEPKQRNAVGICNGYLNKVYIPKINQYVEITGTYVLDLHHGWMELHPVSSISIANPDNK